jgi:hypothetical protein
MSGAEMTAPRRMTTYRGETPCLTGSVGAFARRVIRETEKLGPTPARSKPFPGVTSLAGGPPAPAPALEATQ